MDSQDDAPPPAPILPSHVEATVQAIARVHTEHRQGASGLQRGVESLTRLVSRPRAAAVLVLAAAAWVAANLWIMRSGGHPLDPPPFQLLGVATTFGALLMAMFILITQRREDELSDMREQLMLELAILSEQKAAKVIELLEELRRDLPAVRDRHDPEAHSLARPANPEAVLDALKESRAVVEPGPG